MEFNEEVSVAFEDLISVARTAAIGAAVAGLLTFAATGAAEAAAQPVAFWFAGALPFLLMAYALDFLRRRLGLKSGVLVQFLSVAGFGTTMMGFDTIIEGIDQRVATWFRATFLLSMITLLAARAEILKLGKGRQRRRGRQRVTS